MIELNCGDQRVVITNDPTYSVGSADNVHQYGNAYRLDDSRDSHVTSRHAVQVFQGPNEVASSILLAGGGASCVHERSAVIVGESCIVAVGSFLAALKLPSLELGWATQTDEATCFGVYVSDRHQCLISHGELEIARVSFEGKVAWRASGADIFTNGFTLDDDFVRVRDWNDQEYTLEVESGREVRSDRQV